MPFNRAVRRIVFLDRETLVATVRAPSFAHTWIEHGCTRPEEAAARLAGAHIAITNKVPITEATLSACPSLELVAVAATGVDVVDLAACEARGVAVANIRGYATTSVPEHVLAVVLALRRQLFAYRASLAAGAWSAGTSFALHAHPIEDLAGARFGVVGYGALGRATGELMARVGMEVVVAERRRAPAIRPGRLPFEEVLSTADVLSLHCPLDDETRGLIDARALAHLRPGAILVNTARGGLVDPEALLHALDHGPLGGAAIDVLPTEPPPHDHPLLRASRPDLLVTPHVAWASRAAQQALADQLVDNLEAFAAGSPRNLVTLAPAR